ncbi:hypothetical protein NMY22_g8347 [Coprinellus aureogranulatus]|nr:hypothetical protein NMY22_g8347 [Coprinellus aureogranulatus]
MSRVELVRQALSKANNGDVQSLWRLNELLFPQYFPESAIEVALRHLKPDTVPSRLGQSYGEATGLDSERTRAALPSVGIISRASRACSSNTRLKRSLIPLLIQEVHGFCLWSLFLFEMGIASPIGGSVPDRDLRHAYLVQAQSLTDLMKVDTLVKDALFLESAFLKLLNKLWVGKDSRGDVVASQPGDDDQPACPIVICMMTAVQDDVSREHLTDFIRIGGYHMQRRFARATVMRVRKLSEGVGAVGWKELTNANYLFGINEHLLRHNSLLHLPLERAGYFPQACKSLGVLFHGLSLHPDFTKDAHLIAENLIDVAFYLFKALAAYPTRNAKLCRDALVAGILPVLARIATFLPSDASLSLEKFGCMTEIIGWNVYHPCVFKELMTAQPPAEIQVKLSKMPVIGKTWADFRRTFKEMRTRYREVPFGPIELCDYPLCDWKQSSRPRECSGCSSVIYCSLKCQAQDWEERHRDECPHARADHRTRRSVGTWYSHATRTFHTKMVASYYDQNRVQLQAERKRDYPNLPANHALHSFRFTPKRMERRSRPLVPTPANRLSEKIDRDTAWWDATEDKRHPLTLAQDWLRPRLSHLVEGFRDGDAEDESVRVVEGSFLWGETDVVFLTIMLRKDSEGHFRTKYCISRYGEFLHAPYEASRDVVRFLLTRPRIPVLLIPIAFWTNGHEEDNYRTPRDAAILLFYILTASSISIVPFSAFRK